MEPIDRKARFEHRRARLAELLQALEPAPRAWFARAIDRQEDYIARLLLPEHDSNRKNIGDAIMSAAISVFRLPAGWFDMPLGAAIPEGMRVDEEGRVFFDRPFVNRPNGLAPAVESVKKITGIAFRLNQDLFDALLPEQRSVVEEVTALLVRAFASFNKPPKRRKPGEWKSEQGAVSSRLKTGRSRKTKREAG